MKKLPILFCMLILSGLVVSSCDVENCSTNTLAYLHFSLVDQDGKSFNTSDTITIIGETTVNDTLVSDTLINQETGASSFSLLLSYNDYTRFVFAYTSLERQYIGTDTIRIDHRNIPYFTSLDCGTMMFYEITQVQYTHHRLDSLTITNPNIDNNEKENIKLYFTVTDLD